MQTVELVSPELTESIILTPASDIEAAPELEPEPAQLLDIKFDVLDSAAGALGQADLDSFWDEALTPAEESASAGNALSFEQALKLGLVPKEEKK